MNDTPPIQLNTPEEGNRGAGDMLRMAREAQGMSLEALAMILKVAPAKLSALEEGRLDQLPDANYVRAFAQTICRALKMDAVPVLAALPAARHTPLGSEKPPLNQPFKENRLAPKMFERHEGLNLSELLSLKWLAPLLLLVAAGVVYLLPESVTLPAWLHMPVASVGADALPPEAASAASAASEPEADATAGVALGEASVVQAASEPLFGASGALGIPDVASAASAAPSASGPASVTASAPASTTSSAQEEQPGAVALRANQDTWVEIMDGTGAKRLSRLVAAGEALTVGGPPPWNVRIGNVSGVQVSLRGAPVDLSPYARANVARMELK